MRCPKCSYNSFDHNINCPKCKKDLTPTQKLLGLLAISPQATDFIALAMEYQSHDQESYYGENAPLMADMADMADNSEGQAAEIFPEEAEEVDFIEPLDDDDEIPLIDNIFSEPEIKPTPEPAQINARPEAGAALTGAALGAAAVYPARAAQPAYPIQPLDIANGMIKGQAPQPLGATHGVQAAPVTPVPSPMQPAPVAPMAPFTRPSDMPGMSLEPAPFDDDTFDDEDLSTLTPRLPQSGRRSPVASTVVPEDDILDDEAIAVELEDIDDLEPILDSEATMVVQGSPAVPRSVENLDFAPEGLNQTALDRMPLSHGLEAETFTVADLPLDPDAQAGELPDDGFDNLDDLPNDLELNLDGDNNLDQVEDFSASAYNELGNVDLSLGADQTSLPLDNDTLTDLNFDDSDLDELFADDDDPQPK